MRLIITALVVLLFAQVARAETYRVPVDDQMGGFVYNFLKRIDAVEASGASVVIDLPVCTSACTFWLGVQDVCVDPKTIFEFHGPQSLGMVVLSAFVGPIPVSGMSKTNRDHYLALMKEQYDRWPGLGDWFMERAANRHGLLIRGITGASLNRSFGVPLCEGR